jgi:O-antigen ligase
MKSLPGHRHSSLKFSEGLVSAFALAAWLFLQAGSRTFTASLIMAGLFVFWAAGRPRAALCGLLVFAASTPLLSSLAGVPWYSPAEGALLGVWAAASWRRGRAPALDNRGLAAGAFALYAAGALALLLVRFHYPGSLQTLAFLTYPLRDLLKLQQYTPLYAFRAVAILLEGILAFHLFRRFSSGGGLLKPVARALVGAGALAAFSFPFFWLPRLYNPAGNWMIFRSPLTLQDPNSAASFGLLVLAAGAALAWSESSRLLRWTAVLPGVAILLITGSRTANLLALLAAGGLVVLAATGPRRTDNRDGAREARRALIWGGAGAFVLLLAVLGVLQSQSAGRYKNMFNAQALAGKGFSGRLGYWDAGLRMTAAYPLTGIGPGEFVASLHNFLDKKAYPYSSDYENAHCYPLQIAAELGIPGLLLWLLFLLSVFRPVLAAWKESNPVVLWLAAGAGLYLLHCLQSHPLLIPEQQILFFGLLGVIAGATVERPMLKRGTVAAILIVVAAAGLIPAVWTKTPEAKEAKLFGLFPPSSDSDIRWSAPQVAVLCEGSHPYCILVEPGRPDAKGAGYRLQVKVDGMKIFNRRMTTTAESMLAVRPPAGTRGYVISWVASPPFVPKEWGKSLDDRRLGIRVRLGLPDQFLQTQPQLDWHRPADGPRGFQTAYLDVLARNIPVRARRFGWRLGRVPKRMAPSQTVRLPVTIQNESSTVWPGKALLGTRKSLNVAYHWLDAAGNVVLGDGTRSPIVVNLAPGASFETTLSITAPDHPGLYLLQPDVVQENVAWFQKFSGPMNLKALPEIRVK